MTDHIPADKVRKIATAMRDAMRRVEDDYPDGEFLMDMSDYIRDIESLLPAPPRPTLADMTADEREACKRMQADVKGYESRVVIALPNLSEDYASLLHRRGNVSIKDHAAVTPRPDLPRMTWPGTEKPAPALPGGWRVADHKDNGRVIVTTPNNDGRVYYVLPSDLDGLGFDWHLGTPDELTYIDQEADQ